MPTYGGLSPGFERYGGGKPGNVEAILNSLNAQRGTLYDTTQPSNVYLENLALARAIAECWSNNARMANQWDSLRMTEFLSRWEKILGIVPSLGDTDITRRARVAAAFSRVAQPGIFQVVSDQLALLLGSIFTGITHTTSSNAVVYTPAGWSVGSVDTYGRTWYSTIAHILIGVVQPAHMTDGDFYDLLGQMNPLLDGILPAWVTWDWARNTDTSFLHIVNIASSSNTTPVVITTSPYNGSAQHGFEVGDTVTVSGHSIGSYNGVWTISAIGGTTLGGTGTTLTLSGSTAAGAGGATGTVAGAGFFLDGDATASGSFVNLDNETFVP